jgi:osmotically-inducible protein OsmY
MKQHLFCSAAIWILLTIAGCGSNPQRTHSPDVLDDKVTAARVEQALRRSEPTFNHVAARAEEGRVILRGKVPSVEAKSRAEEIARGVNRVKEVENDLRIQP